MADGSPGDQTTITDPDATAERLGSFLRALHYPASIDAHFNPCRGVSLIERVTTFEDRVIELRSEIDFAATQQVWNRACSASLWPHRPTWLHGDLHLANTLIANGTLAGVLDFGDIGGDPAVDLSAVLMLFPSSADAAFERAYGRIDADMSRRSLGWAVLFGLMLLSIGMDTRPGSGHPTYEPIGRSTLARAIERLSMLK
jgi:aminoglycoside phosphotransferase (APT) family kinase protein